MKPTDLTPAKPCLPLPFRPNRRVVNLRQQGGIALVIGMVVLGLMTLTVLSAVTLSTGHVKAVSNMQFRDAAFAAANVAVEQVVGTAFMDAPKARTIELDINRDGTQDYAVTVPAPTCIYWRAKHNDELDTTNPADLSCFSGARSSGLGGASPVSFCADTRWEVRGQVTDTVTNASVTVNQGIAVRISLPAARNACDRSVL